MKRVLVLALFPLLLTGCIGGGRGPGSATSFMSNADLMRCERCLGGR